MAKRTSACNQKQANRYLQQVYLPLWNRRFACAAEQAGDAYRALHRSLELDSVVSQVEWRTVGQNYTVRWSDLSDALVSSLQRNPLLAEHRFSCNFRRRCLIGCPVLPETQTRGTVARRSGRVPDLHLITSELLELI